MEKENTDTSLATTENPNEKIKKLLATAKKPNTFLGLKPTEIETVLGGIKKQVINALPKHLTAERMISVATSIISKNPAIQECTPLSIMGAVVGASILGLNFALGEAYLVPYGKNAGTKDKPNWVKECQLQISYQGYVKLARQSGDIKNISAHVVREGDKFEYAYGLFEKLEHIPMQNNNGKITHAYAVVHYLSGGYNFEILDISQIEYLRNLSPIAKAKKGERVGAWADEYMYEIMCLAKVIKRLAKWMPKSDTLNTALKTDEATVPLQAVKEGEIDLNAIEFVEAEDVEIEEEKTEPK